MRVGLILDESALTAYARLHDVSVGELVKMVEEDAAESVVGVPAATFLTAYAELKAEDERTRLVRLVTHSDDVAVILPLLAHETLDVARVGSHAVVETKRHRALLATYHAAAARRRLPDDDVLDLAQ